MGARTFNSDSTILATAAAGLGGVQLWDVSDPAHPVKSAPPMTDVGIFDAVIFAKQGATLFTASHGGLENDRGTLKTWDVSDPENPRALLTALTAQTAPISELSVSADGRSLAVSSSDGTVRVYNLTSLTRPIPLTGRRGASADIVHPPDGASGVLVGRTDDGLVVWDAQRSGHPGPSSPLTGDDATVSPDGTAMVVTGGRTGTELWNITSPTTPRRVGALPSDVNTLALNTDGSLLISSRGSKREPDSQGVDLWSTADASEPKKVGTLPGSFNDVALDSPDHRLATTDGDGRVRLWDITDPSHPAAAGPGFTVSDPFVHIMKFSPDGRTLAFAGVEHQAEIWNVSDPKHPKILGSLIGATDDVTAVAFSPSSKSVVVGSRDGSIRLWGLSNATATTPLQSSFSVDGSVDALMFTQQGGSLLAVSNNLIDTVAVQTFRTDPEQSVDHLCAQAGARITREQWKHYLPELNYDPPCQGL
jgi:WD40 repeat protein